MLRRDRFDALLHQTHEQRESGPRINVVLERLLELPLKLRPGDMPLELTATAEFKQGIALLPDVVSVTAYPDSDALGALLVAVNSSCWRHQFCTRGGDFG